jgi:three-Cys-motif partner protein
LAVDHRFGSPSTELKLDVVGSYLKAFTTALRNYWPELWYIDAFAGTGSRTVSFPAREQDLLQEPEEARIERLRGSAQIALDVRPLFQRLIFIEKRPTFCAELDRIAAAHPDRDVRVCPERRMLRLRSTVPVGAGPASGLSCFSILMEWKSSGAP